MERQKRQIDMIRKHLEDGKSITPMQALELYGCMRLGARIADIRMRFGLRIKSELKYDNGKRYAEYTLQ